MRFLGVFAAAFAGVLLLLPALRVAQGRLPAHLATGLWISGAGFLLLALAALVLRGGLATAAVLAGVTCAVAGNIIQRRRTRPPRGRDVQDG